MAGLGAASSATAGNASSGSGSGSQPGSTSGTTEPAGIAQSPTAAESLARQPTTADLLTAEPTRSEFVTRDLSSASDLWDNRVEIQSQTTAERIINSEPETGNPASVATPPDFEETIYSYKDDNISVDVGRARWDFKPPADTGFNSETVSRKLSGGFTADLTGAEVQGKFGPYAGEISTNGKVTALTANAHATYEAGFHLKGPTKPGANANVSAGAEAMAINGRVGAELNITPKSLAEYYNNNIDPIVDYVAGKDVPELPELSDNWDHGVTLSGHVEGGYGAALKGGVSGELGNGRGAKVGANWKIGLGPVVGGGFTFGLK